MVLYSLFYTLCNSYLLADFYFSDSPIRNSKPVLPVMLMNFFSYVFAEYFEILSDELVDLILIFLKSWIIEVASSFCNLENPYLCVLIARVLSLFLSINCKIRMNADKLRNRKLHREWVESYNVKIAKSLVSLLFHLRDDDFHMYLLAIPSLLRDCLKTIWNINMTSFELVPKIPIEQPTKLDAEDAIFYPLKDDECSVLMGLNKIIIAQNPAFYLSAHALISRFVI